MVVKWTDEDNNDNWKPGWYAAKVQSYNTLTDEVTIVYFSEPESIYHVKVNQSVEKGTLRLANCPSVDPDLYDRFTEIGTNILVKWDKYEVGATGWKPGWYAAEVQAFYPHDDK